MRPITFPVVAVLALSVCAAGSALSGCTPQPTETANPRSSWVGPPPNIAPPAPDSPFPPAVLSGEGELVCNISSKENGTQKLVVHGGSGLEFDVVVSPIVDDTVNAKGPDQGGMYRFTSHLAKPATGKLAGVGEIAIEELETKVSVEMMKYQQPGGPGTALTFTSKDMARRGIYVEFAGRGKSANGDKYAFRVILGAPTGGSGNVEPRDSNYNTPIASKMVVIQAPLTTVVTTSVQKLP